MHVSLHVSKQDRKMVRVLMNSILFSWEKWGAGQNPSNQFVDWIISLPHL